MESLQDILGYFCQNPHSRSGPFYGGKVMTVANGDSKLRGQSRVTLIGFRSGVDGEWAATRVVHKLTNSGYSTHVEAEIPAE